MATLKVLASRLRGQQGRSELGSNIPYLVAPAAALARACATCGPGTTTLPRHTSSVVIEANATVELSIGIGQKINPTLKREAHSCSNSASIVADLNGVARSGMGGTTVFV
jgi:hypothetical protein